MNNKSKILAFWASDRINSTNKMLIDIAINFLKEFFLDINVIDLKNYPLPFFDPNLKEEDAPPKNVKILRDKIMESDILLIASPEYNYSMPAILKNLIDWASRSDKNIATREAFRNKKVILMSASGGSDGGSFLLRHLKSVFEILGSNVISNKIAIGRSYCAFDKNNKLVDKTLDLLMENELMKLIKKN
jgi:NAD(P)H-dependent FMN reductase